MATLFSPATLRTCSLGHKPRPSKRKTRPCKPASTAPLANSWATKATTSAPALFDKATQSLKGAGDGNHTALAICLVNRGTVAKFRGDADAVVADAQAALAQLGTPRPGQRALAISARSLLADGLGMRGRSGPAIEQYERTIADLGAAGRERTLLAAIILNNFGSLLSNSGLTLRAATTYEHALDRARGVQAADDLLPPLETNYAKILVELGRANEAKPIFERVMAVASRRGHPRAIGFVALAAAAAWRETGDLARSEAFLTQARSQLQATLPANHSAFAALEVSTARLDLARRAPADARAHLDRALAIYATASEAAPSRIKALELLARVEQQLNEGAAAREHAAKAVALAREIAGGLTHIEWLGSALLAQGAVLAAQGDKPAAQAALREALAQLQASVGDEAPATREARALLAGS